MAFHITEFKKAGSADYGPAIQAPEEPPLKQQTVAIGAASTQSSVFHPETRLCRIHTTAACFIDVGENPTASSTKRRMPADATEFISIPAGKTFKLAVVQE